MPQKHLVSIENYSALECDPSIEDLKNDQSEQILKKMCYGLREWRKGFLYIEGY